MASSSPFLQTYSYSAIGNLTGLRTSPSATSSYTYAETNYANPHAATSIGGTNLTYDNNGNVLTYGSNAYTWDYRNQLMQGGTGSATSTYEYDYQGNRVSMTIAGLTTRYANRLYSTNGATTTKHIYAGDVLVATVEKIGSATTTHIIHTDHLGGTNVVTNADGDLAQTLDYYPFGSQRISQANTSFNEKKQFTGHEYDEETDLTYAQARYYSGNTARFLSQDPVARDNPNQLTFPLCVHG